MMSWHSLSPEKRPLKRCNAICKDSRFMLSHPDVYPQDPKQEEDKMSSERLKSGYILPLYPMEYDSLLTKNIKFNLDEAFLNSTKVLLQVLQKKNELNVISLDKKRIREGVFPIIGHTPISSQKFFAELVGEKRSLHTLIKRFPLFKKKDECMDDLYACKVPIQKAIWFFKMNQVVQGSLITQNKQKRPSADQYAIDQTKLFTKYLREMCRKFENASQIDSLQAYQRWPYDMCLFKHSFEEGIIDRYEFLMELCDITNDYVNFNLEKPQIFRILIIFLSQFVDVITQSAILSRKIAYIIASRFKIYKRDYDRKRGSAVPNIYSSECFADLVNCQHHRAILMTMFGLLHAIIIDCPAALIWNPFDNEFKCGSPLDLLPCSSDVLTQHLPKSALIIDELLRYRLAEIKRRSWHVENRWVLNPNSQSGFEIIVDVCLNVISFLDKAVLNSPKALLKLYRNIFCMESNEKVQKHLLIQIRTMLQWAITTEREGSHRALIVCNLLKMRKRHYRNTAFGSHSLQDILIDYLNKEGPTVSSPNFRKEFANLMLLFYELQRFGLFSHDAYVRALMRSSDLFSYQNPVMSRLRNYMDATIKSNFISQTDVPNNSQHIYSSTLSKQNQSLSNSITNYNETLSNTDPAIISFIPTTSTIINPIIPTISSTSSMSLLNNNFLTSSTNFFSPNSSLSTMTPLNNISSSSMLNAFSVTDSSCNASLPLKSSKDSPTNEEHAFMEFPVEMTFHERFFIHLPIEQTIEQRDTCNQRSILLYGIAEEREIARQELRKIAVQICRTWQKKMSVEFVYGSKEIRYIGRLQIDQINECLSKFKCQTYYDQHVICGWCAENFIEMICEFVNCNSLILPMSESLDMLCFMMEMCQNFHGIVSFTVELLSQLILMEKLLASFSSDYIPNTISCQLAYVLVAYLSENFYYFLYSKEASFIINGLYRIIEKELCAEGFPITGWARTIAIFVFHVKNELLNAKLCKENELLGSFNLFYKIFPESGADKIPRELRYNKHLMTDLLENPGRFYPYHDYKLHLPSIEDLHTQYSFIVNAFLVAKKAKRNFIALAELSHICGHISAEKKLAGEWCVAIQELCSTSVSKTGYSHLISELNIDDLSLHYTISTFVMLLASKYCFSTHALFKRLLNNVFWPFIKVDAINFDGSEMGLSLALLIISCIICGTDQPFQISCELDNNLTLLNGMTLNVNELNSPLNKNPYKYLERNADERALKIIHIRELDSCIFPILSAICILTDSIKSKLNSSSNINNYRLKRLQEILKCSFLSICEQEWVVNRVFRICETTNLEAFNNSALKHNSIGQQLLRIALRRKSERLTKQQLMVCNGNSKKSVLDKLLSSINLWNMRATYYDLKLMIKESSPDGTQKQQHIQQQAIAADALICEIGKCCRDLFINSSIEDFKLNQPSQNKNLFRFNQINCYWLISPLINVCPQPDNIPSSFTPVNVKAKFLKEVAAVFDTTSKLQDTDEINQESVTFYRLRESARLLSQQPFLNLVLTCIQGEELDNLVSSLLRYLQAIINKTKENPTIVHQTLFAIEREGLLLRLNLIGGLFDSLFKNSSTAELWALALFQLLFYEIISVDRDGEYFDVCYDMLSTLIYGIMATSTMQQQNFSDPEKRSELRTRYPAYNSLVKKIKKELGDKNISPDFHCLAQLLPIPKSSAEINAWDCFSTNSPQKNSSISAKTSGTSQNFAVRLDQQPSFVQNHIMRLFYHTHYNDFPAPGIVGAERYANTVDIYLSPPVLERINSELFMAPLKQSRLFLSQQSILSNSNQAALQQRNNLPTLILPQNSSQPNINDESLLQDHQMQNPQIQTIFSSQKPLSNLNTSTPINLQSNQNQMFHMQQNSMFVKQEPKLNLNSNSVTVVSSSNNSISVIGSAATSISNFDSNVTSIHRSNISHPTLPSTGLSGASMTIPGMLPQLGLDDDQLLNNITTTSVAINENNIIPAPSLTSQQTNLLNQQSINGSSSVAPDMATQTIMRNRMFGAVGMSSVNNSSPSGLTMSAINNNNNSGSMPIPPNMRLTGIHHNTAATIGFLSDTSRSGSSTPNSVGVNESPQIGSSTTRGGRRKNATLANNSNVSNRAAKRKKQVLPQHGGIVMGQNNNSIIPNNTKISHMGMPHNNIGMIGGMDIMGSNMSNIGNCVMPSNIQQMHAAGLSGMPSLQQQQFLNWQQMQQQNSQQQLYQQQMQRSKKQSLQDQSMLSSGSNTNTNILSSKSEWNMQQGSSNNNNSTALMPLGGIMMSGANSRPSVSNPGMISMQNVGSTSINTIVPSGSGTSSSRVASHVKDESKLTLQQKILQRMNANQHVQNPHHQQNAM